MEKVRYVVNIVIVTLMIAVVVIKKEASIADIKEVLQNSHTHEMIIPVESVGEQDESVINSTSLARDVFGFAGHTPIENVRRAAQFVSAAPSSSQNHFAEVGLKGIVGLGVLLLRVVMNFAKIKNKAPFAITTVRWEQHRSSLVLFLYVNWNSEKRQANF